MDFGQRLTDHLCLIMFILCELFFSRRHILVSLLLGDQTDPFQNADTHVRLANPNGQKADKARVRFGRPIGVALSAENVQFVQIYHSEDTSICSILYLKPSVSFSCALLRKWKKFDNVRPHFLHIIDLVLIFTYMISCFLFKIYY